MDYNTPSARESLTRADAFGEKLERDVNFHLTSPFTYLYNCIAYAMGMQDRWVDSADLPWHWWPPVHKGMTETDLIEAFRFFGFEECGMDDSLDADYDKVALYCNADGWTHAARVVGDGVYHSKFGASYNGTHSNGDVLQAQYGKPFVIMRRPKTEAHLTDDRKGTAPGVIHTNFKVDINGQYDHIVAFGGKTYLGEHGHEVRIVGGMVQLV
jgi:hypothetical protein